MIGDRIAFHPGYYVEELVENSGLSQEDFAKRLNTTPKNLSDLINAKQNLSTDMAEKLSRMTGTSIQYWLNLQAAYDALIAEEKSREELEKEREVFRSINYQYFRKYFNLPAYPRQIDKQIEETRKYLRISSLTIFTKRDSITNFRNKSEELNEKNIICTNIMVQIAMNKVLDTEAPRFNRDAFRKAVDYARTITRDHDGFYQKLYDRFLKAGVVFTVLPNMPGSKTNGAVRRVGHKMMLMVNDRRKSSDVFWFTLFHEIGHIMNNDYGVSLETDEKNTENMADQYAEDQLIAPEQYQKYISQGIFTVSSVSAFAEEINRDPGIIVGRLQNDGYVRHDDKRMNSLKTEYDFSNILQKNNRNNIE